MQASLLALQQRLQHVFSDPALLQRAVTHRSFSADHNERLEFLGDSVLNLAVSSLLYERLRTLPEGDQKTAVAVTQEALAAGAAPMELITGYMVPAMDKVGSLFECEEYFVPELLLSARAMNGTSTITHSKPPPSRSLTRAPGPRGSPAFICR